MKKTLCCILALALVPALFGCASSVGASQNVSAEQAAAPTETVVFADPTLERMVRAAIGKQEGDITVRDASAVTSLDLSFEWQRYLPDASPIRDIAGLERFTNLKTLDLSYHAIADITPIAGLTQLVSLTLTENPIADLSPLAGLHNLTVLALGGTGAQDCSALAQLTNIRVLDLSRTQVADITPLAALKNLKRVFLQNCPVKDFTPLTDVYETLKEKDFKLATKLEDLGFVMNRDQRQASYEGDGVKVLINHPEWGEPQNEWERNCIWLKLQLPSGFSLEVGDYVAIDAYVFQIFKDGEMRMNYVYDEAKGSLMLDPAASESAKQVLQEALGDSGDGDLLLSPIPVFVDTIVKTFGMEPDALYAMQLAPTSLSQLGFAPETDEQGNAAYSYHIQQPHKVKISIFRPPMGQSRDGNSVSFYDADVKGYQLSILYFLDEGRYHISLQKGDAVCSYDNFSMQSFGAESPDSATVRGMLAEAFGVEGDECYDAPLDYLEQFLKTKLGVNIDELYNLPI